MNRGWMLSSLLVGTGALAHVRQRSFYQYDKGDVQKGGVEAIVRWTTSVPLRVHQFAGCLGADSPLSFDGTVVECTGDAHSLLGLSVAQWLSASFMGVKPDLNVILNAQAKPIATTSACETNANGETDGINNVVFSSKLDPACAHSIEEYLGVIGLTRVRYALTTGRIVEADIQFNDVDYRFVNGPNDLDKISPEPPIVNLKDVAVHELGHLFGLDHSASRTSTMLFAVSDGMSTASSDDVAGMWSLYPNASSGLGRLEGSVALGQVPVFGVPVYVLDARTLSIVSSEMTNLDGAFEFCGLPEGNYIAYANAYRPAGTNIHDFYSGFSGYAPQDGGLCANPGCKRMNTAVKYSWHLSEEAPDSGQNLKIFSVAGGGSNRFLNIAATSGLTDVPVIAPAAFSILDLDHPRLMKFRAGDLSPTGTTALGFNDFKVRAPASQKIAVRLASLSLYSRLNLSISLLDELLDAPPVDGANCTYTPANVKEGLDARMDCQDLVPSTDYRIRIAATSVPCKEVPGNEGNCTTSAGEVASTPIPYYLINAFDPTLAAAGMLSEPLAAGTKASSKYSDSPTCANFVNETKRQEEEPGCCGSLGGHGIDPGRSLWLGLVMSPLTWLLLAIAYLRLRRRFRPDLV